VIRRALGTALVAGACATALLAPGAQAAAGPHYGPDGCDHSKPPGYGQKKATYKKAGTVLKRGAKAKIVMVTSCGTVTIQLATDKRNPIPNSIAFLVTKHFYDGLALFRDVPNYIVQGGDPMNQGTGGPGYEVVGKVPQGYHYKIGDVAMAKTAAATPGTAGSQFFMLITNAAAEQLDTDYGLLGHAGDPASIKTIRLLGTFGAPDPEPPSKPLYIWSARLVRE
jgi:cyclophilin family peptidyl-prolyl cis-trans isomerase